MLNHPWALIITCHIVGKFMSMYCKIFTQELFIYERKCLIQGFRPFRIWAGLLKHLTRILVLYGWFLAIYDMRNCNKNVTETQPRTGKIFSDLYYNPCSSQKVQVSLEPGVKADQYPEKHVFPERGQEARMTGTLWHFVKPPLLSIALWLNICRDMMQRETMRDHYWRNALTQDCCHGDNRNGPSQWAVQSKEVKIWGSPLKRRKGLTISIRMWLNGSLGTVTWQTGEQKWQWN